MSLRGATFRLGHRLIFERTDWTFHQSEHWAILGPNGSGKSVLAEGLRGHLPVVEGELRYHFRPPEGMTHEEAIGHVSFEERKLTVHEAVVQSRWNSLEEDGTLAVGDFLSYERVMEINPFECVEDDRPQRLRFEQRHRRAVRLLHLDGLLRRAVLSLSNGERQRLEMARALCRPLRLLILDDPFSGLDKGNRARLRELLERLMRGQLRVLLITPRVEDLPRSITHVMHVEDCRILESGPRASFHEDRIQASARNRPAFVRAGPAQVGRKAAGASTASPEILIELRNVSVAYGPVQVLHDITWTVCAGESWALLGPNGSGKTTLLSLVLGDNPQAYGNEVIVFGKKRGAGESIWEIKQRIGWVSPELQLYFDDSVTCYEAVASGFSDTVGMFERPTSRQHAAVRNWLEKFELLEFANQPLFGLSAGQQRMALLARALVKSPPLVILDEPCQGLDAPHRRFFLGIVDSLIRSRRTTVIFVTHRPDEIPPSVRRVFRLSEGRGKPQC